MVTLVARSVLVNTMAALCANLALLTGAKAEPNNYGRGGGGRGQARAGPWHGGGGEPIPAPTELSSTSRTSFAIGGWFNVDCSLAEELYSLNDQIAAEAATITCGGGGRGGRVGGEAQQGYRRSPNKQNNQKPRKYNASLIISSML